MQCDCGRLLQNLTATPRQIRCLCGAVHDVEASGQSHPMEAIPAPAVLGRQQEHWRKLHRFPLSDDWGCKSRCRWWQEWQASIPNINCDCRKHWKELVESYPPDFSSREAFFAWSVEAHNRVNDRLGKPRVSLEEALRLHGQASGME